MVTASEAPRLILHLLVAAAGVDAFLDPPSPIVENATLWVAVVWAASLALGGALSVAAVLTGYLLPHMVGLGLEVLGVAVYAVAVYQAGGRTVTVWLLTGLAVMMVDRGVRLRRHALRVPSG